MATNKTALTLAIGSAIAASMAAVPASAAENPFAAQSLSKGYMVAEAAENKCGAKRTGEAKCGSKMKQAACGEGKCGTRLKKVEETAIDKKVIQEGACGGNPKLKERKCGYK